MAIETASKPRTGRRKESVARVRLLPGGGKHTINDRAPGEYLRRLHRSVAETLGELGFHVETPPGRDGLWGRTGQLAAFGVAVRNWVTYYGAYLNVCPPLGLFRLVQTEPLEHAPMSSLVAERCGPVKMTIVRATLVRRLAEAFGCDRYHLHTGHPMLRSRTVTVGSGQ